MDVRFSPHNSHLEDPGMFARLDPTLRRLHQQPLIHRDPLLEILPRQVGIYTITGGRQVGKTTLLKQWMADLLSENVQPSAIIYLSGELIDDHHSLVRIISDIVEESPAVRFLLIDEVTYIRQWDKGIKFLADAGHLENIVLVLTGSDMLILQEARMRFPGRRGSADTVDFHLYPLSFFETIKLKKILNREQQYALATCPSCPPSEVIERLFFAFSEYLIHGGFMTAINDFTAYKKILPATMRTYSDWIRGDVLKRGKNENYLREIIGAVINRYGSQITWNNLLSDMSIEHPKTAADYVQLLEAMDATYIQSAIREDRLCAAPKKAKKIVFTDPFIFHALNDWVRPGNDDGYGLLQATLADSKLMGQLVEACAVSHCRRLFPTFYIKAKGEVDIACVVEKRFVPVEIKWTTQLRPGQLKQISKYSNGLIWTKNKSCGNIGKLTVIPLPLALYCLEKTVVDF